MKPWHKRMFAIALLLALLGSGLAILLYTFQNFVSFYQTPSDILHSVARESPQKTWRLGAYVKNGSIKQLHDGQIQFVATDGKAEIVVIYKGPIPQLFREGQGVVVDGILRDDVFWAKRVLAKHDEVYTSKVRTLKGAPT